MQPIVDYCLSLKCAEKDYPFGPEPLVMKVGGKMFAIIADNVVSLKCDPVIAENLREQHAAVKPGYHLNKKHWNSITVDGSLPLDDVFAMIRHSYELVFKGLPKAERQRIDMLLRQP
ncbi:MmcQ/YjbR family DNA-binding protein [Paenibacillus sp. GCM10023250]|uniref:MmcQ/YjbR family DNA-binding protein n=1 Tax=Paenibacillus sp. GCM10023250 TaxID=3252648 RepID=UPI003621E89F